MKIKYFISFIALFNLICASSQNPSITLSFTADSVNQHIPLNSILIENLTQGGDTSLYAPDTIFVLDYITGIDNIKTKGSKEFIVSQNYPNPINDKTMIDLYLPRQNIVFITVSNIMGKDLIHYESHMEGGHHTFSFFPCSGNIYMLKVQVKNQIQTIKMLNSPSHLLNVGNCRLEYSGLKNCIENLKSGDVLNDFVFNHGDLLKFTANTDLGERVITSSPTYNQTYYFHYNGTSCPDMPTVTDIDGNTYNTVFIGSQCWMKENLKTTTYNNGTPIPNVLDDEMWTSLSTGAYVWWDNDSTMKDLYGGLYNWFSVMDTNGLCPSGWHVPAKDEWAILIDFVGGNNTGGALLKSCRQIGSPMEGACNTLLHPRWNNSNLSFGVDEYGFTGFPGGIRSILGNFYNFGIQGYWWTTTEYSSEAAWMIELFYGDTAIYEDAFGVRNAYSIRCLRD